MSLNSVQKSETDLEETYGLTLLVVSLPTASELPVEFGQGPLFLVPLVT